MILCEFFSWVINEFLFVFELFSNMWWVVFNLESNWGGLVVDGIFWLVMFEFVLSRIGNCGFLMICFWLSCWGFRKNNKILVSVVKWSIFRDVVIFGLSFMLLKKIKYVEIVRIMSNSVSIIILCYYLDMGMIGFYVK